MQESGLSCNYVVLCEWIPANTTRIVENYKCITDILGPQMACLIYIFVFTHWPSTCGNTVKNFKKGMGIWHSHLWCGSGYMQIISEYRGSSPLSAPNSSCMPMCTLGDRRWQRNYYLRPWYLCGRPGLNSRLPAWVWLNLSWRHLGIGQ